MNALPKPLEAAFAMAENGVAPEARQGISLRIGPGSEMAEGACQIVQHGTVSIGVYRVNGSFRAIRNYCPHQGAPLCRGTLHATYAPGAVGEYRPTLEGRVLRCPWHGWEFDLITGKGLYDARDRVKTYATRVDNEGIVFVEL